MLHDPLGVVADQRRRSHAWLRLRHSVSTARTAVREIAAMPGTDATLPRLRDYPIAQHPAAAMQRRRLSGPVRTAHQP